VKTTSAQLALPAGVSTEDQHERSGAVQRNSSYFEPLHRQSKVER
jgi:hypothetical protein